MSSPDTTPELQFEVPGPGSWTRDNVHFPRPMTRYWTEIHPEAFKRGTGDFARFYGMLIDGLESAYVNGFGYNYVVPAPEDEIPRRLQRAQEVIEGKLWREQLEDWDRNCKPAAIAQHRSIQAVDPDALSDEELSSYLTRCRDHHSAMISQHMRFTGSAIVPIGDFVAHAAAWTGVPPAELLALMRGSAQVSAGGSDEQDRLIAAVRADPAALELLQSTDDPSAVLERLRSLEGETGAAVAAYLDLVGNRLLDGFDIVEPTAVEMPDALLRAIRVAVTGNREAADVESLTAAIRAKVPAEHRDEFDELLGEARLMYRLRDERGVYSDIWASGLMRRAVLAAGRRLADRGLVEKAEHLIDASLDEMKALLAGSGGPSGAELAKRAGERAARPAVQAPPSLGPAPPPPPDLSQLPPAAGRLMGATFTALDLLFGSSEAQHEESVLRGLPASGGVYEGPARRVSSPAEFGRLEQGDVLVTEATTEAFNILLPLLGGIVTDRGGLLSHSAIVAREYGIPGVVGTREATRLIEDGTRVRVDGDAGEVTVLG